MAIVQPGANDILLNDNHALMHRVMAIDSSAPAQALIVGSSGNVGIGTTTPNYNLHVIGSTFVDTATNQSIRISSQNTTPSIQGVNDAASAFVPTQIDGNPLLLNVQSNADVYTNAWADYSGSSTIVGWGSISSQSIFTKKVGKTVFVYVTINGTSNATTVSFTVPYTIGTTMNLPIIAVDNGAQITTAQAILSSGGAIITLYTNISGGTWTASGNKVVIGQFWYQSN